MKRVESMNLNGKHSEKNKNSNTNNANKLNLFLANVSHVETRYLDFTCKMFEKHLWKSDILSKDAVHRPASLLKMRLFHGSFSNILLVKTNYLVYP